MPDRISKNEMFMEMAELAAKRSTCVRRKVGAVITDAEGFSIVGMGYNGNAKGLPDTCDRDTPGDCGCLHAEVNALIKSPFHQGNLYLYTTTCPCVGCAKLILNSKVVHVFFRETYRFDLGILLLSSQGIKVTRIIDGGMENELINVNGVMKEYAVVATL